MSDKKITDLNSVTLPLEGTEELAIVQTGETKKIEVSNLVPSSDSDIELIDKVFNISHTGTTANTTVYTINIPANTFKEGSRFYVKAEIEKIDNNAVYALRFRFNNNLSTGLLYAKLNISATLDYYGFERTVSFTDTQAVTMRANAGSNNTDRNTSDVFSKVDFDTTQSADFEFQIQLGSSLDTVIVRNLMLINIE